MANALRHRCSLECLACPHAACEIFQSRNVCRNLVLQICRNYPMAVFMVHSHQAFKQVDKKWRMRVIYSYCLLELYNMVTAGEAEC